MFAIFSARKARGQYRTVPEDDGDLESSVTQVPNKSSVCLDHILIQLTKQFCFGRKRYWKYALAVIVALDVFLLLPVISTVSLQPCRNPKIRKEWRFMAPSYQIEYINSIQCLMNRTSQFELGTSRWDDFAYAHTKEGTGTHYTGAFLTWHRYFLQVYEDVLVNECGFRGSIP